MHHIIYEGVAHWSCGASCVEAVRIAWLVIMLSLFCRDLLIGLSGTKQNDERSSPQTQEFSGKKLAAATFLDSLCKHFI